MVRPLEAGLVLKQATAEEFLPSVRPWVRFAGLWLVGSFASGMALMAAWPYRVVVRASGLARPSGETSLINAPRDGRVRQIRIQPNQRVERGEVIAVLDPTDLEGRQLKLQQDRQALRQQLESQRQEAAASEQAAVLEVDKAQAALALAESEYKRYRQLVSSGAVTVQQMEEKAANLSVSRSNLAKARQAVQEQSSRNATTKAQFSQQLTANAADRAQLRRDLGSTLMRSPVSGSVLSVALRNPLQVVAAGQELARIAPRESGLLVKVLVSSEDIANVQVGQRGDLRLAGCPYPDFGTLRARVLSVAPDAVAAAATPEAGANSGGGSAAGAAPGGSSGYEVTLKPDRTTLKAGSRSCGLRLGMDLTADITTRQENVLTFFLRKARLMAGQ